MTECMWASTREGYKGQGFGVIATSKPPLLKMWELVERDEFAIESIRLLRNGVFKVLITLRVYKLTKKPCQILSHFLVNLYLRRIIESP